MKRAVVAVLVLFTVALLAYFFNQYWIHRYDALISRQATVYRVDPDLVWSIIYEETYFSPWKVGRDGEIGLMQVTPIVGREWATETGMRELERTMTTNPHTVLRDPEQNIQVGCWYLEKIQEQFQDFPDPAPRVIAAYNAGPSRAAEWGKVDQEGKVLTADEFIARIDIPSTRAYVISVLDRYRKLKSARGQVRL
ncbi:MAG TPA: lytic transglycosylase domain-containing protein [Pyrinomonadaceae bacterium]|jgi:soluble lytic murein transglycosylase